MFKKILVPTDASEAARRALKTALELAKGFNSQILLLHVVYTPEALGYSLSSGISVPQEEIRICGREVLAATLDGIDIGTVNLVEKQKPGHPAAAILEEVHSGQFDLIVMGSRGYGPITGSLMGSVSQRILSKAECPVLMVN